MRNFFGNTRHDHPMADMRGARQLLAELPTGDPIKSLEELAHWLDSTRGERFRPEHRVQIALLLDESGQAPARRLGREYIAASRLSKLQESRWWNALYEFWRQVSLSHFDCLHAYEGGERGAEAMKGSLAILCVRTLRSLAGQMKWLHIRYGPLDQTLWGMAGRAYALAERRRVARTLVQVYPGVAGNSSPEQELLKMVLFSVSSPDSLLPVEVDAADRIIATLAPALKITTLPPPDTTYWLDLEGSHPPLRHAKPPAATGSIRYVASGPASAQAATLHDTIVRTRACPHELGLAGSYAPEVVAEVLAHLAMQWSPRPPERKHARHRVKARLTVAHGFDGALDALQPNTSLVFTNVGMESWIVENVSAGGFGATVPQAPSDWLKVDVLVALQPEGGQNWLLGVVRRLSRPAANEAALGLQTLARTPQPVELRVRTGDTLSLDSEVGILTAPLRPDDRTAQIVLRTGVFAPGQSFILECDGRTFVLSPCTVEGCGPDYELIDCVILRREA